jgi:hypothetical protein
MRVPPLSMPAEQGINWFLVIIHQAAGFEKDLGILRPFLTRYPRKWGDNKLTRYPRMKDMQPTHKNFQQNVTLITNG